MEKLTKLTKNQLIDRVREYDKRHRETADELNICRGDLNRAREANEANRQFAEEDRQEHERLGNAYIQLQANHEQLRSRDLYLTGQLQAIIEGHARLRAVLLDAINTTPELQKFVLNQVAEILRSGVSGYFQRNTWRVLLLDSRPASACHPNPRIACIKVVREMLNLGLKEAKDMTDPTVEDPPRPVVLAKGIDQATAERWRAAFESCTARESKYSIERE